MNDAVTRESFPARFSRARPNSPACSRCSCALMGTEHSHFGHAFRGSYNRRCVVVHCSWWCSPSNSTAVWAGQHGMNLQSSTRKPEETGEPFHVQQARQIWVFQKVWTDYGHTRVSRVSVSRSMLALTTDQVRAYFERDVSSDQVGFVDNMRALCSDARTRRRRMCSLTNSRAMKPSPNGIPFS